MRCLHSSLLRAITRPITRTQDDVMAEIKAAAAAEEAARKQVWLELHTAVEVFLLRRRRARHF